MRWSKTLDVTVIDTLRYAAALKQAGVNPAQAEAMSRALNDELSVQLATKPDLDAGLSGLKGELDVAVAGLKGELDVAVSGLKGELDAAVADLKGDFQTLTARVDALDERIGTQGRQVFLVLALLAALGLYNAAAPHFVGHASAPAAERQPLPAPGSERPTPPGAMVTPGR